MSRTRFAYRLRPQHQRLVASRVTAGVLALQAVVLLGLLATPGDPPGGDRLTVWQLLWAWSRQPMFYPLVALLVVGPPMTWLAWRVRGEHRLWLAAGWLAFTALGMLLFHQRLEVMLRVLWWRLGV